MKENTNEKFSNILIAEDDKDDFKFLVEALEKVSNPHHVFHATNGLECISYLKKNEKPDIIFIDLDMPIKNGLDCLKFIKGNDQLAGIPVIIYSKSHYIKDIDAAYKNDAHFYIVKPEPGDVLAEMLSNIFSYLDKSPDKPGKTSFVVRVNSNADHQ